MLSQLEAVNEILGTIRESPINSLDDDLSTEAGLALSILNTTSRDVQREGWAFNTDRNVTFNDDANGVVNVGTDVLKVEFDPTMFSSSFMPVLRGQQVYDRYNQTLAVSKDILCRRVVRMLAWDTLPDVARRYISLRAARLFASRMSGSQTVVIPATEEEKRALLELRSDHRDAARANMLNSPGINEISYRRGTWL